MLTLRGESACTVCRVGERNATLRKLPLPAAATGQLAESRPRRRTGRTRTGPERASLTSTRRGHAAGTAFPRARAAVGHRTGPERASLTSTRRGRAGRSLATGGRTGGRNRRRHGPERAFLTEHRRPSRAGGGRTRPARNRRLSRARAAGRAAVGHGPARSGRPPRALRAGRLCAVWSANAARELARRPPHRQHREHRRDQQPLPHPVIADVAGEQRPRAVDRPGERVPLGDALQPARARTSAAAGCRRAATPAARPCSSAAPARPRS